MEVPHDMRRAKESAEHDLLKLPGVNAVDIGHKHVGGKPTDTMAIRVYVTKKKPLKDVPAKERIPKEIEGHPTDVVERTYVLHQFAARMPVEEIELMADSGRYDPLKGGISIGPCRAIGGYVYVGTLGTIVRDNASGAPMLLSNFHVMCVDNGWSVGDQMAQAGRVDGGSCPADVVGALQRAHLGGTVDCAVASHSVNGTATATMGMAVRKRGRTTGLTYGTVDSVDLSVSLDYGDGLGTVTLTHQIGIAVDTSHSTQIGDHGDSGSVVVDGYANVVGLYFAGNTAGTHGVANPIADVLSALNVSVCTSKAKLELKEHKHESKELKELKEYAKEKSEAKELKEHKHEAKEHKDLKDKHEFKEFKEQKEFKFEKNEFKEHKPEKPEVEKDPFLEHGGKALKDMVEGGKGFGEQDPGRFNPGPPNPGAGPADTRTLEDRVAGLEAALGQLAHFIPPELRPDLATGALQHESDVGSSR
jgi:hypothetical protein